MKSIWLMTIAMFLSCRLVLAVPPAVELVEVRKLWDQPPHSAFTDLIHWRDRFVCAFREGRAHVSTDGKIRVLTSTDGRVWQSAALVSLDGYDLRDAGLSTTPDGRLMLIGGAAPRPADHESAPTGTFVAFSSDVSNWSKPQIVVEPGRWLWRVTWHEGTAYGISYAAGTRDPTTSLLASNDGVHYDALVPTLLAAGRPTEAVLRFAEDGTMYCLQRRDGKAPANSAMLGVSRPPYTEWGWHDLGRYFGGPNLIRVPSGRWIAAGRIHGDGGAKTAIALLDVEAQTLEPILKLPSGGDTSYPGLVWHEGLLWVSYYSSHEGKTSIYLAKLELREP